jgi:uncharacterized repeat protein (TIGR01451 family)
MAIFTNQATLVYNGGSANSNIAVGEIIEVLTAEKTAVEGSYAPGGLVTYVVTLRNSGLSALTNLTVTDNLGGGANVPLTFEAGTALYFVNGVLQATPAITAGPPLVFAGITVPAGGDTVLVYQSRVNSFASPLPGGTIVNTVTITGGGLTAPVTATETVTAASGPELAITKTITPAQVADNGTVTYTFLIQNSGNEALVATDDAAVTDTFDPVLTGITVTLNGTALAQGTGYTYEETTGAFSTVPGVMTVPAATYTQDPASGIYNGTPGLATLTVTGTI